MSSMQVLETQKNPIQNNISIQSKINKGNVKKKESSWLILNNYHNTSKMAYLSLKKYVKKEILQK